MLVFSTWILCLSFVTFTVTGDENFISTVFPETTEGYMTTSEPESLFEEISIDEEMTDDPDTNTIESMTETTLITSTLDPKPMPTKFQNKRNLVVNVQEGALKGVYKTGFYHFMGIKYGQAPIGERR